MQALGRIEIKVTRIKLLGTLDALSSLGINRVSELPEKMLKGKAIENTIEYAFCLFPVSQDLRQLVLQILFESQHLDLRSERNLLKDLFQSH